MPNIADDMRNDLADGLDAPSWTVRARAVERLAAAFSDRTLDDQARQLAEDAFRALVYDGEALVRRVLAECVKRATDLPRDVAVALASDPLPEIAAPVLQHSPVLADDDLLRILRVHPGAHRVAVARRRRVSTSIADALCRCGDESVVGDLLQNEGAAIADRTLRWLKSRRGDWSSIAAPLARRLARAAA